MGLETFAYIDSLVETNPTGTDPKSQGDDHIRGIKSTLLDTFPNIAGAVTPTHTELNYVDGVTSSIQTQLNARGLIAGQAWTGDHTFVTQSAGDNSTKAATTAYVDTGLALKANIASPTFTGVPAAPTASPGANSTQIATTAYVDAAAFSSALPSQTGNAGKFVTTDGSTASWANILDLKSAKAANYTVLAADRYSHFVLTSTATLALTAAATLGDGFRVWVRNDGVGIWTIDPDGSETINGTATLSVFPGESFALICDGSNWRTYGKARTWATIATVSPSAAATSAAFTAIPAYDDLMLVWDGITITANTTNIQVGDSTPTYTSLGDITGTPTGVASGSQVFLNARANAGIVSYGLTNVSATPGVYPWALAGGIKALRVLITSGGGAQFDGAGSITLMGR